MGKGSQARPKSVSEAEYGKRFEQTFKPQHDLDQPKPRVTITMPQEVPDAE